ncbi:MAG: FAD-dependent oxidoreductase, partial [Gammaproteobacteria bacterium]|nr:FAD-dependent oxidoreductase [Gammaproteobacteria bacterium]MBU1656370.1 FAD-dependent oxidoreductase [Gammaproteobacteria bacterium]MBU1959716.1 FAD-dependent oxidoreductase [Gammaproteobacteria bacterium]
MPFSFREGMASLPHRLAAVLGPRLRTGIRVEGLKPLPGGGFRLALKEGERASSLDAASLVVALPAYAAARLLDGLSPTVAQGLAG